MSLILLSLVGPDPSKGGLVLTGLSPLVLMRYALKVELVGTLSGGGLLPLTLLYILVKGKFYLLSTSPSTPLGVLPLGLRRTSRGRCCLATFAYSDFGPLFMAGHTGPVLVEEEFFGCLGLVEA